jgi:hypothetical protein
MTPKANVFVMLARFFSVALVCLTAGVTAADVSDATPAAALRAKYDAMQPRLRQNQFLKPLYLESSETPGSVTGNIYALIKHPFATTGAALNGPARWCDIMMLHLNTKYCRASSDNLGDVLQINIGKKNDQALDEGHRVNFAYRVTANTTDYLRVVLTADAGPFSTRDYRINLEAIPLDSGATFVHFTYSYAYGFAGRVAMQTYLSTIGSSKVGFTVAGQQPGGGTLHIGGMRGLAERNTMRYYLAIEAYLGALSEPPQARLEKRLRDWYAATELYPRQLHEVELGEYLDMKRKEYLRLQARIP